MVHTTTKKKGSVATGHDGQLYFMIKYIILLMHIVLFCFSFFSALLE